MADLQQLLAQQQQVGMATGTVDGRLAHLLSPAAASSMDQQQQQQQQLFAQQQQQNFLQMHQAQQAQAQQVHSQHVQLLQAQQHAQMAQQTPQMQQAQQVQQAQLAHAQTIQQAQQVQQLAAATAAAIQQHPTGGTPEMLQQYAAYQQYLVQLQGSLQAGGAQQQLHGVAAPGVVAHQPMTAVPAMAQPRPLQPMPPGLVGAGGQLAQASMALPAAAAGGGQQAAAAALPGGAFFSFDAPVETLRKSEQAARVGQPTSAAASGPFFSFDAPVESLRQDGGNQASKPKPKPLGEVQILTPDAKAGTREVQSNSGEGAPMKSKGRTASGVSGWVTVEERGRSRSRRRRRRRRSSGSSRSRSSRRSRRSESSSSSERRRPQPLPIPKQEPIAPLSAAPVRVAFKAPDAVAKETKEKNVKVEKADKSEKNLSIMEQFEEQRKKALQSQQQSDQPIRQFTPQELLAAKGPPQKEARRGAPNQGTSNASRPAASGQGALPKELQHLEEMIKSQEQPKPLPSFGNFKGGGPSRGHPGQPASMHAQRWEGGGGSALGGKGQDRGAAAHPQRPWDKGASQNAVKGTWVGGHASGAQSGQDARGAPWGANTASGGAYVSSGPPFAGSGPRGASVGGGTPYDDGKGKCQGGRPTMCGKGKSPSGW
mmetsp:Transcript_121545/g.343882  ORF Transcript_121545/g.343882 Transcript_121545/m.343882 type:complete len:654 (-) Transcript_121545:30-1991(-)